MCVHVHPNLTLSVYQNQPSESKNQSLESKNQSLESREQ